MQKILEGEGIIAQRMDDPLRLPGTWEPHSQNQCIIITRMQKNGYFHSEIRIKEVIHFVAYSLHFDAFLGSFNYHQDVSTTQRYSKANK